jgi:phage anti-repressor protein
MSRGNAQMDNIIKQEILFQLESEEQFPVDFDIYWKWLEFSSKGNAKRAFERAGFILEQDFHHIIPKENVVKRAQGGGSQFEKLMLTIDCAKSFAMMARTEKGREVRMWYLELEKEWRSGKMEISQLGLEVSQEFSKIVEFQYQIELQQRALLAKTEHLTESLEAHEKWLQGIDSELDRIESPKGHYFTVVGYANLHKIKLGKALANTLGRKASAYCRKNGMRKEEVFDSMFGTVGNYPQEALEFVFQSEGFL